MEGRSSPKRPRISRARASSSREVRQRLSRGRSISALSDAGVPSAIVDATPWDPGDQSLTDNRPLLPRHLRLHDLGTPDWKSVDVVTGRRLVLGNADVRISYVVAGETSPLYRNAVGDEVVYLESGSAIVEIPLRLGPEGSPTGTYEEMLRTLAEQLDEALRR